MISGFIGRAIAVFALAAAAIAPTYANANEGNNLEAQFDSMLGTQARAPRDFTATYANPFEQQLAQLANGSQGRIGIAAIDLATGQEIGVFGDQRFPMASTSKIAIAATFLEGVEQGRWTLSSEFPLRMPVSSRRFSSAVAPTRDGQVLRAAELIDLMITRSSNTATDALLKAVGGPAAVNDWARRAGISEFNLTRDIATLVRDDGEFDPAVAIDLRDSATPRAMAQLVSGIYQGKWLTPASRAVIVSAMERCITGKGRIPALLPTGVSVAHKTGTLNNTASDIGILKAPDGRAIAVAIYVTGQGGKAGREAKIASLARAIYDGYAAATGTQLVNARY